jgi:hypothetical protein
MGGSQSIETTIRTRVEIYVEQINEQYIKLVNETCTNIITNASNTQIARINTNVSAFNSIQLKNIRISNSTFTLNQLTDIKNTAKALLSLTQDNRMLNDISNQSQSQISQALSSKQDLVSDLKLVNSIKKEKNTEGELNNFINSVKDSVNNLLGQGVKDETIIENTVKQQLKSKNVESTDINNIIKNTFNTNIDTTTLNECLNKNSGGNTISIDGLWIEGGSPVSMIQTVFITQMTDCIISSILSTESKQMLANSQKNDVAQSASSEQKADTSVEVSSDIVNKESTTSFVSMIMGNLTLIFIIGAVIVFVLLLVFGGPLIKAIFGGNKNSGSQVISIQSPSLGAIGAPNALGASGASIATNAIGALGTLGALGVKPPGKLGKLAGIAAASGVLGGPPGAPGAPGAPNLIGSLGALAAPGASNVLGALAAPGASNVLGALAAPGVSKVS